MNRHNKSYAVSLIVAFVVFISRQAHGQVMEFTNFAQWQTAAGSHTTIGFGEFIAVTFITTQYTSLGVTFTDGDDYQIGNGCATCPGAAFPQDGYGLAGFTDIDIAFSQPMYSIAVHHPGFMQLQLLLRPRLF